MKLLNAGLICLLLAVPCAARVITVDDDGPADFNNIQAAIDVATCGDTVLVATGTYNENINYKGKNIIITSTEPNNPNVVAATVIRGDGTTSVVIFLGIENSTCQLRGLTITGGDTIPPYHGGGIQGSGTKATIGNCTITGNSAYRRGGGVFDCDGPIMNCSIIANTVWSDGATEEGAGLHSCDGPMTNCVISDNTSGSFKWSGFGGGLYNCHGPINNCIIQGNYAGGNGGGLYNCDGPITNCTITNNKAQHYAFQSRGGGAYRCGGTIARCTIADNVAQESAGGLYDCDGLVTGCYIASNKAMGWLGGGLYGCRIIRDCVINDNSANHGGGLASCEAVENCVVSGNLAIQSGGGAYICGRLTNCTLTTNKAGESGGAIYVKYSTTLANCILWGSSASLGNEVYVATYMVVGRSGSYEAPSTVAIGHCNVHGLSAGLYTEKDCTAEWLKGNINSDPIFAGPENGDYHLKSQAGRWDTASQSWVQDDVTSPCIDAGDPMSPISYEPFPNGGITNMGAYGGTAEASKSYFGEPVCEVIIAGDINGDCRVDFADFALMVRHWLQ